MSVLTTNHAATASPPSSCGCNGGCGGSCGGALAVGGTFRRPRFFAGQLLTEEDLEALVEYVVGKNRLHNRYLFGDGVVCGLQLACDPCDPSGIKVMPGYALDCCGNDMLVSCPETLDVKALLRDLRARQAAGYQCGDPCEEKDGKRRYGLYLTYRETPVDAVAPYVSGDPCGQQQCQPTRIAEGYGFELRCDCESSSRIDVFKRILACVGDLREAAAAVARAQTNQVVAAKMQVSLYRMQSKDAAVFTVEDAAALRGAPQAFQKLSASAAGAESVGNLPDELEFRRQVADFQRTTAAMTRFRALSPKARETALHEHGTLRDALEAADAGLPESAAAVKSLAPKVIFDPTMASLASESAVLAEKYAVADAPEAAYGTVEARMMMAGAPVTHRHAARMKADTGQLKQWLLERLESSCSITSCTLYDRAKAVRTGDPKADDGDEADMAAISEAARQLTVILMQYFIDCICQALNPSCPDCTDNAVLLGCVEVEDCRVLDLCNLSRRFVLAPTSMRYWLPPLGWFGELVERFCCDFDPASLFRRKPVLVGHAEDEVTAASAEAAPMMMASYAPVVRSGTIDDASMSMLRRLDLTAKDAENVTAFASNMARLAVRSVDVAAEGVRPAAESIFAKITGRTGGIRGTAAPAAAFDEAALRANVAEDLDASLAKEREARSAELGAALEAERAASGTAVKEAINRELSAKRMASSIESLPVVTKLQAANTRMADELKALKAAVAALKKGG